MRIWSLVALAAALIGCSTPWTADTYEVPQADVAGLRTFAWLGGEYAASRDVTPKLGSTLDQQLGETLANELGAKGYTQVYDAESADMHIHAQVSGLRRYVISDESRIGAPTANAVLTPGEGDVGQPSMTPTEQAFNETSVIIFADHPETGRLMWRGSVAAEERVTSREARMKELNEMVRAIAQQFPARRSSN